MTQYTILEGLNLRSNFAFYFFNSPYEDPFLYVEQLNSKDNLIFDMGDVSKVPPSLLMRIKWVFISHTHIDHFSGFIKFLRTILKIVGKEVHIFGPKGIAENVEGALKSFTWNLIDNYDLRFYVSEIDENIKLFSLFSNDKFQKKLISEKAFSGIILDEEGFTVKADIMDHKIPVLGFRIDEKDRYAVNKEKLFSFNLKPGRWLNEVKKKIAKNEINDYIDVGSVRLIIKDLIDNGILFLKKAPSHAYITDIGFTKDNFIKACCLAKCVKNLFIEAHFTHNEIEMAKKTYHLTAYQAGIISGAARAERVKIFHFSQRYLKSKIEERELYKELERARSLFIKEEKY